MAIKSVKIINNKKKILKQEPKKKLALSQWRGFGIQSTGNSVKMTRIFPEMGGRGFSNIFLAWGMELECVALG